jgi:hypothetical protein
MDVMDMTYKDGTFDIIIDKGTMDAIMVNLYSLSIDVPGKNFCF